jgi:hypothetical protein
MPFAASDSLRCRRHRHPHDRPAVVVPPCPKHAPHGRNAAG